MSTSRIGAVFAALSFLTVLLCADTLRAQAPASNAAANGTAEGTDPKWRTATNGSLAPEEAGDQAPVGGLRVTKGSGVLPNDHGQIWREYDIRPYTARVTDNPQPEQAVVDWVLRETGTEVWFSQPLGILSATRDTLRVYHTPEMQQTVRSIVERLVSTKAESHVFGLHLVTVNSPNWRARAFGLIRPVSVQSPGVDAWLVSKENAAVLLGELRKRTDFREHNSPNLMIHNGQTQVLARNRPRNYVRNVGSRDGGLGQDFEMGKIDEGFSLQISPLLSLDENTVDAVVKCQIDQVERFVPVTLDIPGFQGQTQRVQVQVPQLVSWRLHERFRWPADQVLLLSCGVVATPGPEKKNALGIPLPNLSGSPGRADALLFIESKGKASQNLIPDVRSATVPNSRGRY